MTDHVPHKVRKGLINTLYVLGRTMQGLTDPLRDVALYVYIQMDRQAVPPIGISELVDIVNEVEWDEFCDVCEHIWQALDGTRSYYADVFSRGVNEVFARNYFGWELRDGKMEMVGSRAQTEAISQARLILRDPVLAGPAQQFEKANDFYNQRPKPDCENCAKEAISAVEGVARILVDDHSLTLPDALKRVQVDKGVHKALVGMLAKLYGYGSDEEGVRHARTSEKEVRREDAELVLGVCAHAIVYLARLYGRA